AGPAVGESRVGYQPEEREGSWPVFPDHAARARQVATNYALLVYAAIFVISAEYFQRTDFARNLLGIVAIVAFFIHWYLMFLSQSAIEKFWARLYWIYRTYFNREEQAGLDLPVGPEPFWVQWQVTGGLVL